MRVSERKREREEERDNRKMAEDMMEDGSGGGDGVWAGQAQTFADEEEKRVLFGALDSFR